MIQGSRVRISRFLDNMSLKRSDRPLDMIPVEQPPTGQTSNFVDPPSLRPELIAVNAILTALMLLTVSLRVFVRLTWTKGWDISDCESQFTLHGGESFVLICHRSLYNCCSKISTLFRTKD